MVPRQPQSYVGLCTFMIAWVPLGSTLGDDDPFCPIKHKLSQVGCCTYYLILIILSIQLKRQTLTVENMIDLINVGFEALHGGDINCWVRSGTPCINLFSSGDG